MTYLEMMQLFVAWMWKEICIIVPMMVLACVAILIGMAILKQVYGISIRKVVKGWMHED